jgi:hypothetical protein
MNDLGPGVVLPFHHRIFLHPVLPRRAPVAGVLDVVPARSVWCPVVLAGGCEEALLYSGPVLSAALAAWRARPELFTVAAMGRQAQIDRRGQYGTGASP